MYESTTGVFERQYYTIDLAGLVSHARDTLAAYASRAMHRFGASRVERGGAGVAPTGRHHADFRVPDSVRIR